MNTRYNWNQLSENFLSRSAGNFYLHTRTSLDNMQRELEMKKHHIKNNDIKLIIRRKTQIKKRQTQVKQSLRSFEYDNTIVQESVNKMISHKPSQTMTKFSIHQIRLCSPDSLQPIAEDNQRENRKCPSMDFDSTKCKNVSTTCALHNKFKPASILKSSGSCASGNTLNIAKHSNKGNLNLEFIENLNKENESSTKLLQRMSKTETKNFRSSTMWTNNNCKTQQLLNRNDSNVEKKKESFYSKSDIKPLSANFEDCLVENNEEFKNPGKINLKKNLLLQHQTFVNPLKRKLMKIYQLNPEIVEKINNAKKKKNALDLEKYQANLLSTVTGNFTKENIVKLGHKFRELRKASNKKYERVNTFIKEMENWEENIIKNITKHETKVNCMMQEDDQLAHSRSPLPRIKFERMIKI